MAQVVATREQMWAGELPHICVKTGRPTTTEVEVGLRTSLSPWAYLLLLIGIVPFLVAVVMRETVRARLPLHRDVVERHDAAGRSVIVLLVLALTAVVGSIATQEPVGLPVALGLLLVAGLQSTWRDGRWIRVRVVRGTPYVVLGGVHPNFVAAMVPPPSHGGARDRP